MPLDPKSRVQLLTCDFKLQALFQEVAKYYDFTVLEGHRNEELQNKAFKEGKSKLQWPQGKHNQLPSKAVDVAPNPIDWNDLKRFYHFAGFVEAVATSMGIRIRWGGCWNGGHNFNANQFNDLPHFEVL